MMMGIIVDSVSKHA